MAPAQSIPRGAGAASLDPVSPTSDTQRSAAEPRPGEGRAPAPIDLPEGGAQLLGLTAQADLVDFEMLTASAPMAPSLSQRIDVATLAADQLGRFERIGA